MCSCARKRRRVRRRCRAEHINHFPTVSGGGGGGRGGRPARPLKRLTRRTSLRRARKTEVSRDRYASAGFHVRGVEGRDAQQGAVPLSSLMDLPISPAAGRENLRWRRGTQCGPTTRGSEELRGEFRSRTRRPTSLRFFLFSRFANNHFRVVYDFFFFCRLTILKHFWTTSSVHCLVRDYLDDSEFKIVNFSNTLEENCVCTTLSLIKLCARGYVQYHASTCNELSVHCGPACYLR